MASADCMVDLMFSWMDHRQKCADKLSTVASELQSVREKCATPRSREIMELLNSSDTMREATEEDEQANRICTKIQDQFQDVKQKSPPEDPEDVNQDVMEKILKAMAKQSGLSVSELDFGTITNVVKAAIEEDARAGVDFHGEVFSQKDTCQSWEEQIQSGHVTDASQSLRDLVEGILKVVAMLRQTFNCISEVFEELKEVQACLKDPNRDGRSTTLVKYTMKRCKNKDFKVWLQDKDGIAAFLCLVNVFKMMETKIDHERKKRTIPSSDIDVIFVAHGGITGSMISAEDLLPLPLQDVLLYEPWNCAIDATVAYGIARGSIKIEHCCFGCGHGCPIPHDHTPSPVPSNWNSMRESRGARIPEILVTSIIQSDDRAWKDFVILMKHNQFPDRDRVVIPFILPEEENKYKNVTVPFAAVIWAQWLVLQFSQLKPWLHLAACLSKASPETQLDVPYLQQQYSCAPDGTGMWSLEKLSFPSEEDEQLFNNLKDIFG